MVLSELQGSLVFERGSVKRLYQRPTMQCLLRHQIGQSIDVKVDLALSNSWLKMRNGMMRLFPARKKRAYSLL